MFPVMKSFEISSEESVLETIRFFKTFPLKDQPESTSHDSLKKYDQVVRCNEPVQ